MFRVTPSKPPMAPPAVRTLGHARKVCILGTHGTTLEGCPWDDPSWEFWGHASGAMVMPKGRISLYVDLHPEICFQKARKNGFKDYYQWLQHQPVPILMQQHYPEIPQSIAYPLAEMKSAYPGVQFGSLVSYLIAYAIARGVTHIGLYGVEYSHTSEYRFQRGNCQLWMGIAMGRGITLQVSPKSTLLREYVDYAYESHKDPEAIQKWIEYCGWKKNKFETGDPAETGVVTDPRKMVPLDGPDAAAAARAKRMADPTLAAALAKLEAEGRGPMAPTPYQWASRPGVGAAARE